MVFIKLMNFVFDFSIVIPVILAVFFGVASKIFPSKDNSLLV